MRLLGLGWIGLALVLLAPHVVAQSEEMECDCGEMGQDGPGKMLSGFGVQVATSPITWGVAGLGFLGLGLWGFHAGWIPRAAGAVALWSRFDAAELEDHPTRSRIVDLLRFYPGAPTRNLADMAELNVGTLLYHLEILSRFGLVNSQRLGRERVWYLTGTAKPDMRRAMMLSTPARQRLLDLIGANPGETQSGLARATGLSAATVHHHLQALSEGGLVDLRREGARVRCYPAGSSSRAGLAASTVRSGAPAT